MWVTLNLYWTQNIPLKEIKFRFTTSMGHYSQMIGRKFARIPRVKRSWGKAESSARKSLTNQVWDEPWNHTVTPDRGHRTHTQTHKHMPSANRHSRYTNYEKTQCGIRRITCWTHTLRAQTHWARWQQMTRKSHSMTDSLYIAISAGKAGGMASSALNQMSTFPLQSPHTHIQWEWGWLIELLT